MKIVYLIWLTEKRKEGFSKIEASLWNPLDFFPCLSVICVSFFSAFSFYSRVIFSFIFIICIAGS